MTTLDLRVGALSLVGKPGPVSVWTGGDERHPNDFTTAVEHVAVVAGNEATVTVPIPEVRELLRLTVDGALATVGHVAPSLRGTASTEHVVQIHLGAVVVHLDVPVVPVDLAARLTALEEVAVVETPPEV